MQTAITTVGGTLVCRYSDARRPLGRREGLLLTLHDDDGGEGVGEASPLPGYSPDTLADVQRELAAWRPTDLDGGADVATLLARATRDLRTPSARFAVESAVLDWFGRRAGHPAHRLLGGPTVDALPLAFLLPVGDAAAAATLLRERGVRHVKLKVGADTDAELRALRAVRAVMPDAEIRLDANGMLAADRLVGLCAAYASIGVSMLEEPCPLDVLTGLPRLAVPVALDESLAHGDAAGAMRAVARVQSLAAVVLKPTTLGGIRRCQALAETARALGAETIVTHTLDGPVAMAAAAELALALPGARLVGLAPHECLSAYPSLGAAALGASAVTRHDAPGLGLREAP